MEGSLRFAEALLDINYDMNEVLRVFSIPSDDDPFVGVLDNIAIPPSEDLFHSLRQEEDNYAKKMRLNKSNLALKRSKPNRSFKIINELHKVDIEFAKKKCQEESENFILNENLNHEYLTHDEVYELPVISTNEENCNDGTIIMECSQMKVNTSPIINEQSNAVENLLCVNNINDIPRIHCPVGINTEHRRDPLFLNIWPSFLWERIFIPGGISATTEIIYNSWLQQGKLVYWIRNTYRVKSNLCIEIILWLSNLLKVPIEAIVVVTSEMIKDLTNNNPTSESLTHQSFRRKSLSRWNQIVVIKKKLEAISIPLHVLVAKQEHPSTGGSNPVSVVLSWLARRPVLAIFTDDSVHPVQQHQLDELRKDASDVPLFAVDSSSITLPRLQAADVAGVSDDVFQRQVQRLAGSQWTFAPSSAAPPEVLLSEAGDSEFIDKGGWSWVSDSLASVKAAGGRDGRGWVSDEDSAAELLAGRTAELSALVTAYRAGLLPPPLLCSQLASLPDLAPLLLLDEECRLRCLRGGLLQQPRPLVHWLALLPWDAEQRVWRETCAAAAARFEFPANVRSGNTANGLFNAAQHRLLLTGSLAVGAERQYWLTFLLVTSVSSETGLKTALLETAAHSAALEEECPVLMVDLLRSIQQVRLPTSLTAEQLLDRAEAAWRAEAGDVAVDRQHYLHRRQPT